MAEDRYTKILTIKFDKEINPREIPYFRGAIIASMGKKNSNLLFHNHDGADKLRYSYPLIQYKRIDGKAAIVCVNEGIEEVDQLLLSGKLFLAIGNRNTSMSIERVIAEESKICIDEEQHSYKMSCWTPLNTENFEKYLHLESIIERIEFLQHILIGNILSMCKGIGIDIDKPIKVAITSCSDHKTIIHKGQKKLSFDIEFKSNICLPNNIGLGKNSSLGYGLINRNYKH